MERYSTVTQLSQSDWLAFSRLWHRFKAVAIIISCHYSASNGSEFSQAYSSQSYHSRTLTSKILSLAFTAICLSRNQHRCQELYRIIRPSAITIYHRIAWKGPHYCLRRPLICRPKLHNVANLGDWRSLLASGLMRWLFTTNLVKRPTRICIGAPFAWFRNSL